VLADRRRWRVSWPKRYEGICCVEERSQIDPRAAHMNVASYAGFFYGDTKLAVGSVIEPTARHRAQKANKSGV